MFAFIPFRSFIFSCRLSIFIINASSSLFNNKYYLIASLFVIYFTLTFSLKSGWGTGVPHFRSLVMQRGLSPSLSHERVICLAFAVQSPASVDLFSHCSNWVSSYMVGKKENKYSNENYQMSYPLPTPDAVILWIIQHFVSIWWKLVENSVHKGVYLWQVQEEMFGGADDWCLPAHLTLGFL